jgi:hypothetical protein
MSNLRDRTGHPLLQRNNVAANFSLRNLMQAKARRTQAKARRTQAKTRRTQAKARRTQAKACGYHSKSRVAMRGSPARSPV